MAKISDNTEVSLPLRNMISMIAGASLATWAYFGLVERLNKLETNYTMQNADVEMNTEFRIKCREVKWEVYPPIVNSSC